MGRLEEIKDEYAKEQGYKAWDYYTRFCEYGISDHVFNEVAKRYARECCIATQKACAEQAMLQLDPPLGTIPGAPIIHESITNPDNIVLL